MAPTTTNPTPGPPPTTPATPAASVTTTPTTPVTTTPTIPTTSAAPVTTNPTKKPRPNPLAPLLAKVDAHVQQLRKPGVDARCSKANLDSLPAARAKQTEAALEAWLGLARRCIDKTP
jgi:hypothetical protein